MENNRKQEENKMAVADQTQQQNEKNEMYIDAVFLEEAPEVQASYFKIFGLASLLYAIVYTVCMFRNSSGITMPVWVAATILYAIVCLRKTNSMRTEPLCGKLQAQSWFSIAVMLLLGMATFLTDQIYIISLNYLLFFVTLILFLLHNVCDDSQWDFSKSLMEITAALFGAVGCIILPFQDGYACWKEKKTGNHKTLRAASIGLLLAVPAILFIGFCLACADAVFDVMVVRLFSGLYVPAKVMEAAGMLLFGFFSSYCGMRYFTHRKKVEVPMHRTKFDPVIAITFAGLLLMMYLIFCGVQILYLFAGNMQLPKGMTYAQYAHRGFYMLLFVCLINFSLVLVLQKYFTKHKILDGILLLICGCTYVMIASSAYRMFLYIGVYQLTFLRLFVLAVLAALALLMAGVMTAIVKTRFPLFRCGVVVVSVIYLCLAFAKPDALIAAYNLSHAQQAERMDWYYLSQLSLDAAPAIAAYYEQADAQVQKQMQLAAGQAKQIIESKTDALFDETNQEDELLENVHWFRNYMCKVYRAKYQLGLRNFNRSRYRAVKLLENL